jgi:hypothetical protein
MPMSEGTRTPSERAGDRSIATWPFLTQNRVTIDAALIFGGSGAISNLVDGQVAAAIAD